MNIAILGATSQIAQDLILSFSKCKDYDFSIFGRNVALLQKWINSESLSDKYQVQEYSEFANHQKYDVIINFVGIGDPVKAQKMGSDIFKITEEYDDMALEYLKQHKKTKYIFLSSGAVYGGNYQEPVNKDTVAIIDINNLKSTDWYAISKLYAEAKHRSLSELSIIDVRVFNYFSHTQDMNARFLITDIVRALKNNNIFITSPENIVRDYITPPDFFNLIQSILKYKSVNLAVDCRTKSPIDKFSILSELEDKFGLQYEILESNDVLNATGKKLNYFSFSNSSVEIGFVPSKTSLEGIVEELELIHDLNLIQ